MISLYRLGAMYRDVELALIATDGEVTPDIENMFDAIKGLQDDKLCAIAALMKNADAECEALKREEQRLKSMRQSAENRIAKLGELAQRILPYGETWTDGLHKISYRPSKAVEINESAAAIPAEYMRTKVTSEPDKAALKKALEAGEQIAGVELVTRYNLQVK